LKVNVGAADENLVTLVHVYMGYLSYFDFRLRLLDRRSGTRLLFNVSSRMDRLDIFKIGKTDSLASGQNCPMAW
jgi:hypothetical protein